MQYNPKKYTYSNDKILIIPYIVRTLSSRIIIIMSLLKRKGNNIQLFSKHSATNIREDRIPIMSKGREVWWFLTESELCPPGLCVNELVEKYRLRYSLNEHTLQQMFGRTEFRFCQKGVQPDYLQKESELCPPCFE